MPPIFTFHWHFNTLPKRRAIQYEKAKTKWYKFSIFCEFCLEKHSSSMINGKVALTQERDTLVHLDTCQIVLSDYMKWGIIIGSTVNESCSVDGINFFQLLSYFDLIKLQSLPLTFIAIAVWISETLNTAIPPFYLAHM